MPRKKKNHKKFEDCIDTINREITKRRNKWNLTSLAWMDYEDVSQIIRIHIFKKWDMYDQAKPLGPWLNRIISNQIKNIIRNNYGNYARPCIKCAAAENERGCVIYGSQCSECPLYAHWAKNKKRAHDTKLPVSLENHSQEVYSMITDSYDIESAANTLHEKMKKILKPIEWKVYDLLYIQNKEEKYVAKQMGYFTSEKNRLPGYKQIKNIKKSIITKVKVILLEQGL